MAFNLNKNDDTNSKLGSSNKSNSSSKFDLSKNNNATVSSEVKKNKFKNWIFALIILLLIGGGTWYFLSTSNSNYNISNKATVPNSIDSSQKTQMDKNADTSSSVANSAKPSSGSNSLAVSDSSIRNAPSGSNSNNLSKSKNGNVNSPSNIGSLDINKKIPASFAKSSAELNNIDMTVVKYLIAYLEKNKNASIVVNGYASSEGKLDVNQKIAQARADAFKKYLLSKGIASDKIVANSKGIDNPIASNDTEEGRQKNRRVEISLH